MTKLPLFGAAVAIAAASCTSIECPLDNQVLMTLSFYNAQTQEATTLTDTLSVYGIKNGTEYLAFNRGVQIKSMLLPLNPTSQRDTFLLRFSNTEKWVIDSLFVDHQPHPHFEAIDCPASTFHVLTHIDHTSHTLSAFPLTLDSFAIANPNVQYEDVEHLKVFLRTPAQ